jgi:membrane protein DedA with SNARE-associated domain
MSLESFIITYGYPALLIGTFLEGETILIIAGFLAYRQYLSLPWVIVVAFLGTFAGDQLFFYLGRTKGNAFLKKRPHWEPKVQKVRNLLELHHTWIIIGFRFLYGFRNITPFGIGMSGFSAKRFFWLNALGGLVWSSVIASGGYFLGQIMESFLVRLKKYELRIIVTIAVIGSVVWTYFFIKRKISQNKKKLSTEQ